MLVLEEQFRRHLEAFASELFIYIYIFSKYILYVCVFIWRVHMQKQLKKIMFFHCLNQTATGLFWLG